MRVELGILAVAAVLGVSGCATTAAIEAAHPELASEAAIAHALVDCVDPAVAAAIGGSWEAGVAQAGICLANLVANQLLPKQLEERAMREVLISAGIKLERARAKAVCPAPLPPAGPLSVIPSARTRVREMSWEELLARPWAKTSIAAEPGE